MNEETWRRQLREALDKFPHLHRRTTPDPERAQPPLATNENANRAMVGADILYRPIKDTSIGK